MPVKPLASAAAALFTLDIEEKVMAHLQLVSDNRAVAHPYRTRMERERIRTTLGIVAHSGGRMLPAPLSVFEPGRHFEQTRGRPNAMPVSEFVNPGLRSVGPQASPTGVCLATPSDKYIIDHEE